MFAKTTWIAAAMLGSLTLGSIASPALAAEREPCVLRDHPVGAVVPYRTVDHIGKAAFSRVRGASLFVEAQPGLTAEWLGHELKSHLAAMKSEGMPDCPLDLAKVKVDVRPSATGFWVRLVGPDTRTGEEILRRAQLLHS